MADWKKKFSLLANPVPGDVVACLQELDVDLFRVEGDEAKGQCPAHFENTGKENSRGDWSVNIEDGAHNCFSCGFRGSFVSLVKYVLDCSVDDAVAWIRERGGIERVNRIIGKGSEIFTPEAEEVDESDLALFTDPPASACRERDIEPWAAREYRVLWDKDRDLWITCIREFETDRLIGWQEKNKRHFLNYPEHLEKSSHVYGINDVPDDCDTGIIVESPLDCPHILSADVEGAVSTMGAWISDAQLDILCDRFDVLISALDNDAAGEETNRDLRKRVNGRALLRFWNYGDLAVKDPGDQPYRQVRRSYHTAYNAVMARWD